MPDVGLSQPDECSESEQNLDDVLPLIAAQVRWELDWGHDPNAPRQGLEIVFEQEIALAALLLHGKVFLNTHHWKSAWPEDARDTTALCVLCNDVFLRGSADAEGVLLSELEALWDHHEKDPVWGTAVWIIKKRDLMPQSSIYKAIKTAGLWDLDSMGLRRNAG